MIEAMPAVIAVQPDTELVICGTGALRDELQAQAERLGVAGHVRLAGLVDNEIVADYNRAADVFVLPSLLEALPTVAVEALACGTPVVSADHPGGVELHGLFGDDVAVVPREDSGRLAAALIERLGAPRRTLPATAAGLTRHFRPAAVRAQYFALYASLAPRLAAQLQAGATA
jgi:glycosyltransferase involved in cell wall biosynthesis